MQNSALKMAEGELNVDSLISRLLEGKIFESECILTLTQTYPAIMYVS